jgi:hypothetical protein
MTRLNPQPARKRTENSRLMACTVRIRGLREPSSESTSLTGQQNRLGAEFLLTEITASALLLLLLLLRLPRLPGSVTRLFSPIHRFARALVGDLHG